MNIQELLNNPIVGGAAMMTAAGTLLFSLKALPGKIWARIVRHYVHTVRVYDYDDLFYILGRWLYQHHGRAYKEVEARLDERSGLQRANNRGPKKAEIILKQEPSTFWLKADGKWLIFSSIKEKLEHADNSAKRYSSNYTIKGFRARASIQAFLERIANEYYESIADNQLAIFYNSHWGEWLRASPIRIKPLDKIILSPGLKEDLLKDLNQFISSKEWYFKACIPYKRQFILHGDPGTGKTSLCLAIAAYLNLDVYVMNIKSFQGDQHMQRAFTEIAPGSLLLIEDIDASFNMRESSNKDISFSALLNCMDGAFYKEGLLTCITTNHFDKLDPALIRPGRTDRTIHVGFPSDEQIDEFLSNFYGDKYRGVFAGTNARLISMSAVQESCISNRDNPKGAVSEICKRIVDRITAPPNEEEDNWFKALAYTDGITS